jgi:hypothetical protein
VSTERPLKVTGTLGRKVEGTIEAGEGEIVMVTTNGSIRIR